MPSNEITWALYGMAIVAAPIVAVWLWRRLGQGKRHKLGREVAPGWYMGFDGSTVGDMRIEPAPYSESAKALGSKVPESHEVWATRQLEKLGALCHENERRIDALEAKEPETVAKLPRDAFESSSNIRDLVWSGVEVDDNRRNDPRAG